MSHRGNPVRVDLTLNPCSHPYSLHSARDLSPRTGQNQAAHISRLHHPQLDLHTHRPKHKLALLYNIRSTILTSHQVIPWQLLPTQHSCAQAGETQVSVKAVENETDNEAETLAVRMKADLEERFREYQRSLWDLHRAIPGRTPGTPPGLYPTLSYLQPAHPVEGEPELDLEGSSQSSRCFQDSREISLRDRGSRETTCDDWSVKDGLHNIYTAWSRHIDTFVHRTAQTGSCISYCTQSNHL